MLTTLPSICWSIASVTPRSAGMIWSVAYPMVVTYVSPPQQVSQIGSYLTYPLLRLRNIALSASLAAATALATIAARVGWSMSAGVLS
ncbi:Uncharacterised protein [Mycobacteroides abscessus subsp. abscessus]|nr:Uncharacterised protein [Mycobacteroides abscessus subsp. abscessus]SKF55248.1 Uncharacterised protein [Mycobacteroides abscessus subsp. bolletii]SKO49791.1 Uncharacterised protein [Mycobacteroides abscessus subsp. bolletii]